MSLELGVNQHAQHTMIFTEMAPHSKALTKEST